MAAPLQQWMPFHIDRWKGSAYVQAMRAAARAGYLYLLTAAWQTEDCSLPADDYELMVLSGLTSEEWHEFGPVIRRRFVEKDGRLYNLVLQGEHEIAHGKFAITSLERSKAGKKGAEVRWAGKGKPMANAIEADSKPMANAIEEPEIGWQNIATVTGTLTGIKKPSRSKAASDSKHPPDPRHAEFKAACKSYAERAGVVFTWDGAEGTALCKLLARTPDLTLQLFQKCIDNRMESDGIAHGDQPRAYLRDIMRFQEGPRDKYNKVKSRLVQVVQPSNPLDKIDAQMAEAMARKEAEERRAS